MRLNLKFTEGSTRIINCIFVDPVSDDSRLRATLAHQLQILNWPAALDSLRITLLASAELTVRQLTLFHMGEEQSPLMDIAQKLSRRHAAIFLQSRLTDAHHPVAARRVTLSTLVAA